MRRPLRTDRRHTASAHVRRDYPELEAVVVNGPATISWSTTPGLVASRADAVTHSLRGGVHPLGPSPSSRC